MRAGCLAPQGSPGAGRISTVLPAWHDIVETTVSDAAGDHQAARLLPLVRD